MPFHDMLADGTPGPDMILVAAGSFRMGSPVTEPGREADEGPQHEVDVPAYAIGRTELRIADYDLFAAATGRPLPDDNGWGRGDRPVINLSWDDARSYAEWLSAQTGRDYRLPTEAEWEYAARAGTTTPFWSGDCLQVGQANFREAAGYAACPVLPANRRGQTVTIASGSLPANAWGLYELAGNVWEWTGDCWRGSYDGAPADASARQDGDGHDCIRRVLRGGSWRDGPQNLRSANRFNLPAASRQANVGMRLVRTQ